MSLKILYSPLMMRKIKSITDEAESVPRTLVQRSLWCQDKVGLTYRYLKRAGICFMKPSSRVIMNLGLEIWVKDPETGEMEKLELDGVCDWNPRNPKMRASSSSESSSSPSPASTTSA